VCEERSVLEDALARFAHRKIDFADAYLAALAVHRDATVASFDRDLIRTEDVTVVEWEEPGP